MKILALGMTVGALALTTLGAQAQTTDNSSTSGTTGSTTMGGSMGTGTMSGDSSMSGGSMSGSSMSASMAPTPVSGTVTRYYVDQAGFVSAMDVQTTDGTRMVRFSPSMAQRLTAMYPVGSTISGFVTSSGMGSMMNYDLAGTGTTMPAPGMMMSSSTNDLDILRSNPYVMLGSKETSVTGRLTGYVADPNNGQVLALILDNNTLVRVPSENRVMQASPAPEGVRDLLRGALVQARGMDEAPRYGVVSPFTRRIVATGISVDGRTLGTFGFGSVPTKRSNGLVQFGRGSKMNMDYMPYMAPGSDSSMSGTGTSMMGTGTAGTGSMGSGTPGTSGTGTGTGGTQ